MREQNIFLVSHEEFKTKKMSKRKFVNNTYYFILFVFLFYFSKHAKRHPNFNTNALRQRRGNLGESPIDGATSRVKAESVNSSEDTPSEDLPSDKMSDSLPSP